MWKFCGKDKLLKCTFVDKHDLLEVPRAQKLRCVRKKPSLKPVSESTLSADYRKNNVTPATKSGERPIREDSPVIYSSLSDKLNAVRVKEGQIPNLKALLFNQEYKETKKINVHGSLKNNGRIRVEQTFTFRVERPFSSTFVTCVLISARLKIRGMRSIH